MLPAFMRLSDTFPLPSRSLPLHLLIAFFFSTVFMPGGVEGQNRSNSDPFVFDSTQNVLLEEHLGIVNGKLAAGTPYKDVARLHGLWAPPFVSSNFRLEVEFAGSPVTTASFQWRPFQLERRGTRDDLSIVTVTSLIPGHRAGLLDITVTNLAAKEQTVPLKINVAGTLDAADQETALGASGWLFAAPASTTATTPRIEGAMLIREQGPLSFAVQGHTPITWDKAASQGSVLLNIPAGGKVSLHLAFAIGPSVEAITACREIATDPAQALATTQNAYAARVKELFDRLPRLESSNVELVQFYNRSLVPLIMNRWDVPEFVLHPYYSTGSVNGGCVGNYLWDFGGDWELFPLFDPEATKSHIKQFLKVDITKHFAFDPLKGKAWGPWYPVNQEKIIGTIYYYVKNTGDVAFLNEEVAGKTILQHTLDNALFGDDLQQPVALIDYGPSNSHLELRRGIPYNHVMPDLNGRRFENYLRAAELADLMGVSAPPLRDRAAALQAVLRKELWKDEAGWFAFRDATGKEDLRYTVQIFKLFNSKVLESDQEAALLRHLKNEQKFTARYGLESMAKTDLAYDPVDYDNGGGGCFTAFPPQIAERLYKAGHAAEADDLLQRILWWGNRVPYWGDSFACNEIEYRHDTPLQCTIDSAAAAQSIIFGLMGVEADFNGDLRIDPKSPKFARQIRLTNLRLRGHKLDIHVDGETYEVHAGKEIIRKPIGESLLLPRK